MKDMKLSNGGIHVSLLARTLQHSSGESCCRRACHKWAHLINAVFVLVDVDKRPLPGTWLQFRCIRESPSNPGSPNGSLGLMILWVFSSLDVSIIPYSTDIAQLRVCQQLLQIHTIL